VYQVVKLSTKFKLNRTIYVRVTDDLAFFSRGRLPNFTLQRGVNKTAPNLKTTGLHHRCTKCDTLVSTGCFISKRGRLRDEGYRKSKTFLTLCLN